MLQITSTFAIDEKDLSYEFMRASGPGGQNNNKVATAIQLRFDVLHSSSLTEEKKERLTKLAGHRMTKEGVLVIEAKRYRTQVHNRHDAEERLVALIRKALANPKKRKPTRPSATAKAKRVDAKKRRGTIKSLRKIPSNHDE